MAAKKKAKSKKDTKPKDVPEEIAADIEEAVSAEDMPSKVMRSKRIPITHWEEDQSPENTDDESVEEDIVEEEVEATEPLEIKIEESETEEEKPEKIDEVDDEQPSEDEEHSWHLIEEEESEDVEEEVKKSELENEEESDGPEWDEEKWQQANIDEEESESPEWDEEKWQQAKTEDEEESESPEWDEEKWQQAKSEDEANEDAEEQDDATDELAAAAAAISTQKTDVETEVSETTDELAETDSSEVEEDDKLVMSNESEDEVEEDVDQRSASQIALNDDEKDGNSEKKGVNKLLAGFLAWWQKAKLRNSMVVAMGLFLLIFITLPSPRYAALNTVGVRATARVTITDAETRLPLKAVSVSLAGQDTLTNENGLASFDGVKLGRQTMTVTKSAYDTYTQELTISMGDNEINSVSLVSVGTSFEFKITDWLTGDPIEGAEVSHGDNSAYVNAEGVAKLNVPTVTEDTLVVSAVAPGYAEKEVEIDTTDETVKEVELVLDRYHLFVSKRDGQYDVYKMRADGSDEQLLVAGTGNERNDIRFDVSPSGDVAALVATRDKNVRNQDGYILSGMYLIDVNSGEIDKLDSSERIDIVGWIGDRVIYVKVQAGASGSNPDRHRLMSLDTKTKQLDQIASSNFFNDVLVAKDYVFYAPSDAYKENPKPYLFRSNADGSSIETVFEKTVWTVLRTGVNSIQFDSEQVWYEGEIDRIFNVETETRPTEFTSRLYTESPAGNRSAWVDIRDGKGALIIHDHESDEETTIITKGGLRNPVIWISDDHIIYRVVTSDETADYVINVNDGEPRKISDVTNVSGADRWYYYY